MTGEKTRDDILEKVSMDLLSIPQLVFRAVRKRITRTTLSEVDMNITPHHLEIVRLLAENETLRASEIGERLQIARAQMTNLIDKLVALKIVERKIDPDDRRTYNIRLTDEARIVSEKHKRKVVGAVREIMSGLTDEELENLSSSLRNLRDILLKSTADSATR